MTSEAAEEELEVSGLKLDVNDNDEQIRIEAWLDEHPEFFQEYLIRKGKKWEKYIPISKYRRDVIISCGFFLSISRTFQCSLHLSAATIIGRLLIGNLLTRVTSVSNCTYFEL